MNEPSDGLDVFADVITGTLGIVMLTALFFALRAAVADDGLVGIQLHPDLRAQLVDAQLAVARAKRHQLSIATMPEASPQREYAAEEMSASTAAGRTEAALRRDLVRQRVRQVGLSVLEQAALEEAELMQRRATESIEAYAQACGSEPLPARVGRADQRAFFVFVSEGRVQPLYRIREGRIVRNTEQVGWAVYDEGRRLRAYPRAERGWSLDEAAPALREWAAHLSAAGWEPRLLVRPSDFLAARTLLRALAEADVSASWQPLEAQDYIEFSAGTVPEI